MPKLLLVFFQRTTASILILIFLTQTFSRYVIVVDYYLNTAAYAANCVNKDKPWMHCNGHCQMRKRMAQQERSEKQNPERRSANDRYGPISSRSSFVDSTSLLCIAGKAIRRPDDAAGKAVRMPRSFFHPPGFRGA